MLKITWETSTLQIPMLNAKGETWSNTCLGRGRARAAGLLKLCPENGMGDQNKLDQSLFCLEKHWLMKIRHGAKHRKISFSQSKSEVNKGFQRNQRNNNGWWWLMNMMTKPTNTNGHHIFFMVMKSGWWSDHTQVIRVYAPHATGRQDGLVELGILPRYLLEVLDAFQCYDMLWPIRTFAAFTPENHQNMAMVLFWSTMWSISSSYELSYPTFRVVRVVTFLV